MQDRQQQGDARKALLPTGEEVNILDALARGLDLNINAALERIVRIIEHELGRAAAEQA